DPAGVAALPPAAAGAVSAAGSRISAAAPGRPEVAAPAPGDGAPDGAFGCASDSPLPGAVPGVSGTTSTARPEALPLPGSSTCARSAPRPKYIAMATTPAMPSRIQT